MKKYKADLDLLWLEKVKPDQMLIEENLSRAGTEHSARSIKKLADEIAENGYWDPPSAANRTSTRKQLLLTSGFKRWHAALLLDKEGRLPPYVGDRDGIRVLVYKDIAGDVDLRNNAINAAENLDRENPNPYQTAKTFYELHIRHGLSIDELHLRFSSFKKVTIQNYIRIIRQVIPEIQTEWAEREGGEKPIPLTLLLRWAAMQPETQRESWESYKKETFIRRRTTIDPRRSLQAIQTRLSHETNKTARKVLLWVIQESDEDDGDYRDYSPRPGTTRTINGRRVDAGGEASDSGDYRMREGFEGRPNGQACDDSGITSSGSAVTPGCHPFYDAEVVEETAPRIERTPRNARRKRP